jgi:hypothetical protein
VTGLITLIYSYYDKFTRTTGTVYAVKYTLCSQVYTDETVKCLGDRLHEHLSYVLITCNLWSDVSQHLIYRALAFNHYGYHS